MWAVDGRASGIRKREEKRMDREKNGSEGREKNYFIHFEYLYFEMKFYDCELRAESYMKRIVNNCLGREGEDKKRMKVE